MLRTKHAKKALTKKEQRHLTESRVYSMAAFIRTRKAQTEMIEAENIEPCFICKQIARKLGIE